MCVFVVLSISLVLLMVSLKIKENRSSRRFKAIPGPRGWPIVGNIGLKPEIFPQQFKEIGDTHGSMFQLQILRKTFIVIQCPQILHEIFEKDEQCVNRPNYFLSENIFSGKDLAFGNFDEHRQKLKELLLEIIYKTPDLSEVTRQGVSCVMKTFYTDIVKTKGMNFNPDVPMKTFICDCFQLLIGKTLPESDTDHGMMWDLCDWLYRLIDPNVDSTLRIFPFLRFLPGKCGHVYRKSIEARDKVFRKVFDEHKATYEHGKIRGLLDVCFKTQMDENERTGSTWLTDDYIKGLMSDILLAGMTELLKAQRLYLLLMIHHPECQKKAQHEIDTVLGMNAPALEDFDRLPYVQATIMECLRYTSQTPLAIPHKCNTDVVIDGYLIEKDTVIIPNLWGVHHDDDTWGDPWNYRPERFLDENGKLIPEDHPLYKAFIPFSLGPRRCPGEKFSRTRLLMCLATLLQGFTFLPPEDGHLPSPDPRLYTTRYPMYEPQFECRAIPRQISATN
ncbi:hypothetical protein CHS0354_040729 [Potamilus streckersoni]|uniref:Cytochrome P450 n=1 Tax=Potamilus streckersoni TaxID=2493646 RepID=A0AAE0SLL6_9BIVA|nr:hypothetical protein CHS0354_040729 [Potamilus streckersoni]